MSAWKEAYISAQDQIVDEVDDLGHCFLFAAFALGRMREFDGLAIAQKATSQQ